MPNFASAIRELGDQDGKQKDLRHLDSPLQEAVEIQIPGRQVENAVIGERDKHLPEDIDWEVVDIRRGRSGFSLPAGPPSFPSGHPGEHQRVNAIGGRWKR
jgi:hypothetical protein